MVALTALLAVPFTLAGQGMHGHGGEFGILGHLQKAKEALGLSDQQVTEIKAIFEAVRAQNAPYRESLHRGRMQIAQTLLNNPNDLSTAQSLLNQQTEAEKTVKSNLLVAASKAFNILTPEQRAKLADLLRQRAEHRPH
jgi:Spy/CpxP family protein refolding chaperone